MKSEAQTRSTRGRPPSITRERIADAGIAIGLPEITFVGVAEALGVSHMALYKHVPSLEALKHLVAEAIFTRWDFPSLGENRELAAYLADFVASLHALVKANPGLPTYLVRQSAATERMLDKIAAHHRAVSRAYGLPQKQASWLLSTIAFHCIAVADMIHATSSLSPSSEAKATRTRAAAEAITLDTAVMEREFAKGMHALIIGALALLAKGEAAPPKPQAR